MIAIRKGSSFVNLSDAERMASLVAGGYLALRGLLRRDRAGLALALVGGAFALRGVRGHSTLYQHLGIRRFAGAGGRDHAVRGQAVHLERSITIRRPIDEVYRFWRRFENLPRFMENLVAVRAVRPGLYRWVAKAPVGTVTWYAEVIEEQVPWMIAWRSLPGSRIDNAGSVHFSPAPDGEGTEVRVALAYKPPGGALGALFARATGREPGIQVRDDLRRFKRIMESSRPRVGDAGGGHPDGAGWR